MSSPARPETRPIKPINERRAAPGQGTSTPPRTPCAARMTGAAGECAGASARRVGAQSAGEILRREPDHAASLLRRGQVPAPLEILQIGARRLSDHIVPRLMVGHCGRRPRIPQESLDDCDLPVVEAATPQKAVWTAGRVSDCG